MTGILTLSEFTYPIGDDPAHTFNLTSRSWRFERPWSVLAVNTKGGGAGLVYTFRSTCSDWHNSLLEAQTLMHRAGLYTVPPLPFCVLGRLKRGYDGCPVWGWPRGQESHSPCFYLVPDFHFVDTVTGQVESGGGAIPNATLNPRMMTARDLGGCQTKKL